MSWIGKENLKVDEYALLIDDVFTYNISVSNLSY